MENIYYCYIYLDKTEPGIYKFGNLLFNYKPFYVGKGKQTRAYVHLKYVKRQLNSNKGFNYHFYNKIKKIILNNSEPEILIYKNNLCEEEAYELETKLIEIIGLKNLTNVTPGGKGGRNNKNFSGRHHTLEAKKKQSETHKGDKNPMYGEKYFRSEEGKKSFAKKMQETLGGIPRSEETRKKISLKLIGYEWSDTEKEKRSIGMKKVWNKRKKDNVKLNNKCSSKQLKAYNTNEEIIFLSQKQCAQYFKTDFRTIKKYIENNKLLNNYFIKWI